MNSFSFSVTYSWVLFTDIMSLIVLNDLDSGKVSYYSHKYSLTNDPNQAAELSVSQFGFMFKMVGQYYQT